MKTELQHRCAKYGTVLTIVARNTLRTRGQAFVVFSSAEEAAIAVKALHKGALFGKRMIAVLSRSRSFAAADALDPTGAEEYKASVREKRAKRKEEEEQERKQAKHAAEGAEGPLSKRRRTEETAGGRRGGAGGGGKERSMPPNKILFLQELPPGVQAAPLEAVYDKYPGFLEVRLMAVRRLGFVEFDTEEHAVVAREGTRSLVLEGYPVKVTYAKK